MEDVTLLAPAWEKEKGIEETSQDGELGEVEATPRDDDAASKDEL